MQTKTQHGFSFIEAIVVTTIVMIMTFVIFVASWSDRATKELQTAERSVAGVLREAQNAALTGKQFVDGRFPCTLTFQASGAEHRIEYDYHMGTSCSVAQGGVLNPDTGGDPAVAARYTLENDVTFDEEHTIIFSVPFGEVLNMDEEGYIDIPLVKDDQTFHVCLYASGSVEERDSGECL